MKTILFIATLFLAVQLPAQYYFNDIVGTAETNRLMASYQQNKVRTVSATGYDARGAKATDYTEVQEVKDNGSVLKVSTISNFNKTIVYSTFDDKKRIIRSADSSSAISSITTYDYDANGRVIKVENVTRDSANDFNQVETHLWSYASNGQPAKMWRLINNADSLEVRFSPDEDGNTGDERTFRRGRETGLIYYYYDDKKRLSDIVRYNTKAKKLLPDVLFEYDDNDRVIQKITTTSSNNLNYLIWRYIFNEKGLKTKEALFDKDKQLTGKIEFNYTFGQ